MHAPLRSPGGFRGVTAANFAGPAPLPSQPMTCDPVKARGAGEGGRGPARGAGGGWCGTAQGAGGSAVLLRGRLQRGLVTALAGTASGTAAGRCRDRVEGGGGADGGVTVAAAGRRTAAVRARESGRPAGRLRSAAGARTATDIAPAAARSPKNGPRHRHCTAAAHTEGPPDIAPAAARSRPRSDRHRSRRTKLRQVQGGPSGWLHNKLLVETLSPRRACRGAFKTTDCDLKQRRVENFKVTVCDLRNQGLWS